MDDRPRTLLGLPVVFSLDFPKMQLSADCPVTPAFRVEMDAWLLSFFGTTNLIPDGAVYKTADCFHMNPRTYNQICDQADELEGIPRPTELDSGFIPLPPSKGPASRAQERP